jgi:hypothetical protein
MEFGIQIKYERKLYRYTVHVFDMKNGFERYRVIAGNKTLLLESNRPLLRSRNLKHRRPNWKIIEGKVNSSSGLDSIKAAIIEQMDSKAKAPE